VETPSGAVRLDEMEKIKCILVFLDGANGRPPQGTEHMEHTDITIAEPEAAAVEEAHGRGRPMTARSEAQDSACEGRSDFSRTS
jgi:hypothetical protein